MHAFLSSLSNNWIIWFYIIVLLPFEIYDICKEKERNSKKTLMLLICASFAIIAGIQSCIKGKNLTISPTPLYIILLICYIESITTFLQSRTKRDLAFLCIFSLFMAIIILNFLLNPNRSLENFAFILS